MDYNFAHKLAEIIIKTWLNLATEEEREKLLSWLDENEENRQTYKAIIHGETILNRIRTEDRITETTDFKLLCKQIAQKLLRRKMSRRVAYTLYYAAGCAFIFIVSWLYWPKQEGNNDSQAIDTSKVKLVLASGDVISLDKKSSAKIDANVAVIIKDQNGLVYKSKEATDALKEKEIRHKIVTSAGGEYHFVLSDGTKIWLNSVSEIEFPVNFQGPERVINLTGEAYFEVAPDSKRPFIVHSLNQTVQVLGTTFNIKAYPEESRVFTTLIEGKVSVGSGGSKVLLSPGMESVCLRSNNELETYSVDTNLSTAWRTGFFLFNNEDIQIMLRMLSRWYGVEFKYNKVDTDVATFSGRFSKYDDLKTTLNSLSLAGGYEFIMNEEERTVTVNKINSNN